jgi:HD-GYP domain-containing protein (c-di-GMP phosphodiesterase class II)
LTQPELFRLWEHPARGAQLALEITGNQTVSQWVRWHHERWDGLGYPDGLTGSAIPLPARILRLADSADAMLHARPYRGAMSLEDATTELNRLTAISYDPDLAKVFIHEVLPQFLEAASRPAPPPPNDWADASFEEP